VATVGWSRDKASYCCCCSGVVVVDQGFAFAMPRIGHA